MALIADYSPTRPSSPSSSSSASYSPSSESSVSTTASASASSLTPSAPSSRSPSPANFDESGAPIIDEQLEFYQKQEHEAVREIYDQIKKDLAGLGVTSEDEIER